MTAKRRLVYEATVYHDEPEEAAVDSRTIGYFSSVRTATRAINEARDDHWQTGGVRLGDLWEAVPGQSPEWFEPDEQASAWFVGTDGKPDR